MISKNYNLIGLKSEFEAEGLTALEIADFFSQNEGFEMRVVKLGGCEAKTDFRSAVRLGATVVVAPMVESRFAVKKFAGVYPDSKKVSRWINLETRTALENLDEILVEARDSGISGVVIGRGDLAESFGLRRDEVESKLVSDAVKEFASRGKAFGFHVGLGGVISHNSLPMIRELHENDILDHFETRKVLIDPNSPGLSEAISQALQIELDWLEQSFTNLSSMSLDIERRTTRLKSQMRSQR